MVRDSADLTDPEAALAWRGSAWAIHQGRNSIGASAMRYAVALGLLIALYTSANAAPVHHPKRQHVIVRPDQGVTAPGRFAVPGWSDEATRRWLDNASSGVGRGG